MKLVTFTKAGSPDTALLGVLHDEDRMIVDAQAEAMAATGKADASFASMQALIESGPAGLDRLRGLIVAARHAGCVAVADARLLAPLPRPEQIRDALGFKQHMVEAMMGRLRATGAEMSPTQKLRLELFDKRPQWYKCNRFSVCGPDTVIHWPSYSRMMDYELEMALVIGRRATDIAAKDVADHVFGYTIFNDFSARDVQNDEMGMLGPNKSKDFDNGNALGPCIVTADAFDPSDVAMTTRLNGEVQNVNRSSTMTWSFAEIVSAVSRAETIHPGEIIASGTVGGGCGLETGRTLQSGDVIELEIEGIGVLRNQVFAAAEPTSL